jgi:fumarate reductase subunit D
MKYSVILILMVLGLWCNLSALQMGLAPQNLHSSKTHYLTTFLSVKSTQHGVVIGLAKQE